MVMKTTSTLTLNGITYELIDDTAREQIKNINNSGSANPMPDSTVEDAGKFLRVNNEGVAEWQTIENAEGVSF